MPCTCHSPCTGDRVTVTSASASSPRPTIGAVERNPDGTFDLVLSSEPQGGQLAAVGTRRRVCHHPRLRRRSGHCAPSSSGRSRPSIRPARRTTRSQTVAAKFRAARVFLDEQARIAPVRVDPPNEVQEPYPVPSTTFGWAAGDAAYAMGSFQLAEGEALVIDGRSPECAFWNLCLWNPFLHTFDDVVRAGDDQRITGRGQRTTGRGASWWPRTNRDIRTGSAPRVTSGDCCGSGGSSRPRHQLDRSVEWRRRDFPTPSVSSDSV